MKVTFWGVRGSIPTPGPDTAEYGGNTSCVEIRTDRGDLIILDAGTGIRKLGQKLMREFDGRAIHGHLLIGHTHWDHIQGFPFFLPAMAAGNTFGVSGVKRVGATVSDALAGQMRHNYFPIAMSDMAAQFDYREIRAGNRFTIGGTAGEVTVLTLPLRHPGGGLAYRIEADGHSVTYVCDYEHGTGGIAAEAVRFAQDTHVLIHDAQFTDEEYGSGRYVGWGHSTWQQAVEVAEKSNVGRLVIYHHDPNHDDAFMREVEAAARARLPRSVVAREGMTIDLALV
jgi:phosphoribosyl 1,2-cyclic phosphodiesterase